MTWLAWFGGWVLIGLATAVVNEVLTTRLLHSRTLDGEWAGVVVVWPLWWTMFLIWASITTFNAWVEKTSGGAA